MQQTVSLLAVDQKACSLQLDTWPQQHPGHLQELCLFCSLQRGAGASNTNTLSTVFIHSWCHMRSAPVALQHVILQEGSKLRVSNSWGPKRVELDLITCPAAVGWQQPESLRFDQLGSKHGCLRAAASEAVLTAQLAFIARCL
jgi:hypothetical protein